MSYLSFCSWSGGKDSALAFYKAIKKGYNIKYLLTMMSDDSGKSKSHGLSKELLLKQSCELNVKHFFKYASWETYENVFISVIDEFKKDSISNGIFGDIDIQEHLDWIIKICSKTGINYYEPLWKYERTDVINEFLTNSFKAVIVSCNKSKMDEKYLGKELTQDLANELTSIGVDAAGENGEYHTFVIDGPIFKNKIEYEIIGIKEKDDYLFLDMK